MVSAVISGVMLGIGMIIGTRLSANEFEKKIRKILKESPTAQTGARLLEKLDELVANEEVTANAAKFFKAGTELLTSPEAKAFFANVTVLMKELSGEPKRIMLKLPEASSKVKKK